MTKQVDSPSSGAPPFRRAGTVTSVSFQSRGLLVSCRPRPFLRPRRHTRSHRSASSTARTGAPRPRSGSRTSPAAGTTSRPRSRATSASPSRTWGCAAGRAATRPAARTRSRASGCASTAPSGSTRTIGRPKPPRREDKYTNKVRGLAGRREGVARGGGGSRALRRCSEWGIEASVYTFLSRRVVVMTKQLLRGASRRWRDTWRHRRDVDVARDANANNAKIIKDAARAHEREAAYHEEEPAHALPVGLPVGQVLLHPRDAGLEVDLAPYR